MTSVSHTSSILSGPVMIPMSITSKDEDEDGFILPSSTRKITTLLSQIVTIKPDNQAKQCWDVFILILVVYTAITVPLDLGFSSGSHADINMYYFNYAAIDTLNGLCQLTFFIDVILSFMTSYIDSNGDEVTDFSLVSSRYLKSYFIIDLLSCLPFDLIANAALSSTDFTSLMLVKLCSVPRLLRISRVLSSLENLSVAFVFRGLKIFFSILLLMHFLSALLGATLEDEASSWLDSKDDHLYLYWGRRYVLCMHAVIAICFGGSMMPTSTWEYCFEMTVLFIGGILQAFAVGNIAVIMSGLNSNEIEYRQFMDRVNKSLHFNNCNPDLRKEVRSYFELSYDVYRGVNKNEEEWIQLLSPELTGKVLLNKYSDCFTNCPLFSRKWKSGLIEALLPKLTTQLYVKNEIIYSIGTRGAEMFFVLKGTLEEYVERREQGDVLVLSYLKKGDYVGEEALLDAYCRRKASVKACSSSHLAILTRESLSEALVHFPKDEFFFQTVADLRVTMNDDSDGTLKRTLKDIVRKAGDLVVAKAVSPRSGGKGSEDGETKGDIDERVLHEVVQKAGEIVMSKKDSFIDMIVREGDEGEEEERHFLERRNSTGHRHNSM